LLGSDAKTVRARRKELASRGVQSRGYLRSGVESFTLPLFQLRIGKRSRPSDRKKVMILGSGRTASGKASSSITAVATRLCLSEFEHESIMVNCNPETVSTITTPAIAFTSSRSRWKKS